MGMATRVLIGNYNSTHAAMSTLHPWTYIVYADSVGLVYPPFRAVHSIGEIKYIYLPSIHGVHTNFVNLFIV